MVPQSLPATSPEARRRPVGPPSVVAMAPAESLDEARRRNRIKLLRDLVSNGLYRVQTERLAERLAPILQQD
jgi:hypothetical protein